jgi:hypothetical protein
MESKTMKLTKSYKSKEKSYKKELQKQRKASGNGEYNLIKYVRCHHHTRYVSCSDFGWEAHLIRRVSAECFV